MTTETDGSMAASMYFNAARPAKPDALRFLADRPGVPVVQELAEIAGALLRDHLAELLGHPVLVDGRVDRAQHAERRGEARPSVHARQQERVSRVRMAHVVL